MAPVRPFAPPAFPTAPAAPRVGLDWGQALMNFLYGGQLGQQQQAAAEEAQSKQQDRLLARLLGLGQLQVSQAQLQEAQAKGELARRQAAGVQDFLGNLGTPVSVPARQTAPIPQGEPGETGMPLTTPATTRPRTGVEAARGIPLPEPLALAIFQAQQAAQKPHMISGAPGSVHGTFVEGQGFTPFLTVPPAPFLHNAAPGNAVLDAQGRVVYQAPEVPFKTTELPPTFMRAVVANPQAFARHPAVALFGTPEAAATAFSKALSEGEAAQTRVAAASAGAIEKARLAVPNPPPDAQQTRYTALVSASRVLDQIEQLAQSPAVNLGRIAGGIRPWMNTVLQSGRVGPIPITPALFGGQLTPEEQFLLANLHDYADRVLRQRSGAQINETELKRMLEFLGSPNVRPDVLVERIHLQRRNLDTDIQDLENQFRAFGYIVPTRTPRPPITGPPPGSPGGTPPTPGATRVP